MYEYEFEYTEKQQRTMSTSKLPAHLVIELENIAKKTGFTDYTIEQDIGSKNGDGFIADIVKIILTGKRNVDGTLQPDQLDLICKMIPESQVRRNIFCTEKVFEREVAMYNRFLPQLLSFQKEKGLTTENGFFDFPKCYFAISDIAANEHMLIMKDLRPSGFALWDKLKPIDFENVRLVMMALGRFHALSFAIRDQRPELFATFNEYEDVFIYMLDNAPAMQAMFNTGCDQALRMFQKRPEHLEYLQRMKKTWLDVFRTAVNRDQVGRFSVVGHGDCWNNNMMFRNVAKGTGEICLLDWQMSRLGSPALDLSYFLMTSTTKPLRDQHFNEFLQIYYNELAATLRTCGSDPDKLFTFENLQSELKQFGRFSVTIAPMMLQVIVSDSNDIVPMDDYASTIDDGARDMATFDDSSEIRYLNRVSDVINDARMYGWIE